MTEREALKLALEALDGWRKDFPDHWGDIDEKAVDAIKEAFAQEKALQALHDENERLGLYKDAYEQTERESVRLQCITCGTVYADGIPPQVEQPEQEPVIGTKTWFEDGKVVTQHLTAKDIYKDPEQPEQNPVAWEGKTKLGAPAGTPRLIFADKVRADEWLSQFVEGQAWLAPLSYTTPPQRTWVGLTDEEIAEMMVQIWSNKDISVRERSHRLSRAIKAKLKEKNNA